VADGLAAVAGWKGARHPKRVTPAVRTQGRTLPRDLRDKKEIG
jgi:hypothetical protein